jgi:hypothetical protein
VHDGSFGFLIQSTAVGVPVVQLPAAHIDPVPFPPDATPVMLFVGRHVPLLFGELHDGSGGGVMPCSFASPTSQSAVLRFLSRSILASLSGRSHGGTHLAMPLTSA